MLYRQDLRILDLFFENTNESLTIHHPRIGEDSDEYDRFNYLLGEEQQYINQVNADIARRNEHAKDSEFNEYTNAYRHRNRYFEFEHVPDLGGQFMWNMRSVCWSFFPNCDSLCYELFKNFIFEDTSDDSIHNCIHNNSAEKMSIGNNFAIYGPKKNTRSGYDTMSSLRTSRTLYDIIQHITLSLMIEKLLLTLDDKKYSLNEEGQNNKINYSRNIKNNVGLFLQNREGRNNRKNNYDRLNVHLVRAIRSRPEKNSLFRTGTEFDPEDIDSFKWMEETIKIYEDYAKSYANSVRPIGKDINDCDGEYYWREIVFEDYSKLYSIASFYKHMEEGALNYFLVNIGEDKYVQLYHRLLLQLIFLCPYPLNVWLEKNILHDGGLLHSKGTISKELLLDLVDYMYRIIFCIVPGIDYAVKEAIKNIDFENRTKLLEESFLKLKMINTKLLVNNLKFDKEYLISLNKSVLRKLDIALGYDTKNNQSFIDDFVKRKAVVWASCKPQTRNYLASLTGVPSLSDWIMRPKLDEDSITPFSYIHQEMNILIEGIIESVVECDKKRLSFYKEYYNYEGKPLDGELSEREKERQSLYIKCKDTISTHITKDKIYYWMIKSYLISSYNDLKNLCFIIDFVYDILEQWILHEMKDSCSYERRNQEARLGRLETPVNTLRKCSDKLKIKGEEEIKEITEKFNALNDLLNLTCRSRWQNMNQHSYIKSLYEMNDIGHTNNGNYRFNVEQNFAIQVNDILVHIIEYFVYGENLKNNKILQGYQMYWSRHMSFKSEEL